MRKGNNPRPSSIPVDDADMQIEVTSNPPNLVDLPDVLTVEEAAAFLRLSRNGAYEAVQRREIPSIRIGRRVLVPKRRLMELLEILE